MRTLCLIATLTLAACYEVPSPCHADMQTPADMALTAPDAAPDLGPTVSLPPPCGGKVPCHP